MLKKIEFKNFKIFKNDTIIDLTPTKSEILSDTNVYSNVLRGGIFYGGNASGKTTALHAISLLLDFLFKEITFNNTMICLFGHNKYSSFKYTFDIDNNEIIYSINFNLEGIVTSEILNLNGEELLTRIGNQVRTKLTENEYYSSEDVDDKTLFIRKIYFNTKFSNYPVLNKWIDFLKNSIYFNPFSPFNKVVFNSITQTETELIKYLEKYGTKEINDFFNEFGIPYEIEYRKSNGLQVTNVLTNVIFINKTTKSTLPYYLESNGNQVLIQMLPSILRIIKTGGILIFDEFSCALHNKLEELLIKYIFNSSKQVQLFVATHSTNLLKTSIIRPDQVFIVDFDNEGAFISKASKEKPRESQNLEKMYLAGVFGGVPVFENNKD